MLGISWNKNIGITVQDNSYFCVCEKYVPL